MRTISRASQFRSDFKKMIRVPRYRGFETTLREIVECFLHEQSLPVRFQDHALKGDWIGCRECHIRPDLLLIYRVDSEDSITLLRIGTHSNLFRK